MLMTGHLVRSTIHKHGTGRLVLEWVTIWDSRLLYVFAVFCLLSQVLSIYLTDALREWWIVCAQGTEESDGNPNLLVSLGEREWGRVEFL
jgi:hypothetical protein